MKITAKEFVELCLKKEIDNFIETEGKKKKSAEDWYEDAEAVLFGIGYEPSNTEIRELRARS